jgi:acetolactate decarboxylase
MVMCGTACGCLAVLAPGRARAAAVADPQGRFRLDMVGSFAATVRGGETSGRIRADALPNTDVWAVGPTEGLRGELTVHDGRAFVATIAHRQVRVVEDRSAAAPFLVWAEVPRWKVDALPPGLADARALEAHLRAIAPAHGLDPEGPFPFLLTGTVEEMIWHVLDGPGSGPHGSGRGQGGGHRQAKEARVLRGAAMTLVGFYSRRHEDVFTHRGEYSHIHFVTDDRGLSGHVDALAPGARLTLYLPG